MSGFSEFCANLPDTDVWQDLKKSGRPKVLYGMGDGADKIITVLSRYGITPSDVFASDGFVRGHSFHGIRVKSYSEICEKYGTADVLLCFAVKTPEMFGRLREISQRFDFYAPDVPVAESELFTIEYFKKNLGAFENLYSFLEDDKSRSVLENIILYKLTGNIYHLSAADSDKRDAYALLGIGDNELYLDLGAYTGDTVEEFLSVSGSARGILACEPDIRSFSKLEKYIDSLGYLCCKAVNAGVSDKSDVKMFSNRAGKMSALGERKGRLTKFYSPDELCKSFGFEPTLIKMDLEGEEQNALLGSADIISAKPKLIISAYHRTDDLINLSRIIKEARPDYRLYLRKHPYVPAWDINFYAV